jgi:hypothetical protein
MERGGINVLLTREIKDVTDVYELKRKWDGRVVKF